MVARLFYFLIIKRQKKTGKDLSSLSRGQTITEFTLILPFLLILVGGATDWGVAFFVSQVVQNAVREGARIAVTQNPVNGAGVKTEVQKRIPDTPLFSDFKNNVTVTLPNPSDCPNAQVTVATTGTYSFSFLRLIGFTEPITISRATTMRWEWQLC